MPIYDRASTVVERMVSRGPLGEAIGGTHQPPLNTAEICLGDLAVTKLVATLALEFVSGQAGTFDISQ